MTPITERFRGTPEWEIVVALGRWDRTRRLVDLHSELGVAESRLLWLFGDEQARTLRDVADEIGLEQSTVNRQVNAALAEGLLDRRREPGQSAHLFRISEVGRDLLTRATTEHIASHTAALSALPAGAREGFGALLNTYVEALSRSLMSETARLSR